MNNKKAKKKPNSDTVSIAFPERLKQLRMQKGISQRDFANKTNLNYTQYNRYEKGDRKPSTETMAKLADALGVSVDYLLEGEEQDAAIANLEDKDLLRMFSDIEKLPKDKKQAVKIILEDVIKEEKLQQLAT